MYLENGVLVAENELQEFFFFFDNAKEYLAELGVFEGKYYRAPLVFDFDSFNTSSFIVELQDPANKDLVLNEPLKSSMAEKASKIRQERDVTQLSSKVKQGSVCDAIDLTMFGCPNPEQRARYEEKQEEFERKRAKVYSAVNATENKRPSMPELIKSFIQAPVPAKLVSKEEGKQNLALDSKEIVRRMDLELTQKYRLENNCPDDASQDLLNLATVYADYLQILDFISSSSNAALVFKNNQPKDVSALDIMLNKLAAETLKSPPPRASLIKRKSIWQSTASDITDVISEDNISSKNYK